MTTMVRQERFQNGTSVVIVQENSRTEDGKESSYSFRIGRGITYHLTENKGMELKGIDLRARAAIKYHTFSVLFQEVVRELDPIRIAYNIGEELLRQFAEPTTDVVFALKPNLISQTELANFEKVLMRLAEL